MTRPVRIGINGFGRMGRLALRAAWEWPELEFVHINEAHGDAASCAHLLEFDSVHGRWNRETARLEDTLLKASLDYQMELSQRRTLFLGLVANKVYNLNNGTQLILGGSNGLRGYDSHFLNGTGNVQFTAEERYFTDYHWLQLARVGFAMFYDAGRVFGNTDAGAQRLYQNVGFGLRLAPSRSESGQIVHVDLAWPLNSNVPGGGGRQFVVEVKDTF